MIINLQIFAEFFQDYEKKKIVSVTLVSFDATSFLVTVLPKNIISKFESENKPSNEITSLMLLVGKFYSLHKFLPKFYN